MIDTVILHIPVISEICRQKGKSFEIIGDVRHYGLPASSRLVMLEDDGTDIVREVYHAFTSIPTSHTGIAFKFFHQTYNTLPYASLDCSVAKIVQGHNIFGVDSMSVGVAQMLGIFLNEYPTLAKYLDLAKARIARFDVTYSADVGSLNQAEKVKEHLRFVAKGKLRNLHTAGDKSNYNTLYFGAQGSRVGGFKIYCKGVEVNNFLSRANKLASTGSLLALKKLSAYTPKVVAHAQRLIRFEATFKSQYFEQHGLPRNLWQFLHLQNNYTMLYNDLFNHKTTPFFTALQGINVQALHDEQVLDMLLDKLTTTTPTGKRSTTKAYHAYNFYKRLKDDGFWEVKKVTPKPTFYRNISNLVDCGFSLSSLQTFIKSTQSVPILELIDIDFSKQLPDDYQTPQSEYTPFIQECMTRYLPKTA